MEEAVHNAFVLEWNEVCVSVDRIANVEELKEVIMMRVWQVRNIDQHEADGKILQMSRNEAVETNVQFPYHDLRETGGFAQEEGSTCNSTE